MLLGYLPEKASTFAPAVDNAFNFILYVCIFFFVLLIGLKIYFIFKYKRRSEDEVTPRITHNLALEVVWTIIPLIIVMFMFYIGYKTYFNMLTPKQDQGAFTDIYVTGQKWIWEFEYDNGTKIISAPDKAKVKAHPANVAELSEEEQKAKTLPVLTIPVNKPIRLILTSKDVLHSFAVPAFRIKRDVIKNQRRETWFQATQEGQYIYTCNEMCGTDHSRMIGYVNVVSEKEYAQFLEDNKPASDPLELGKQLYAQCSGCHANEKSPAVAKLGPNWWGLYPVEGEKVRKVQGGEVKVNFDYIAKSIRDPQAHIALDPSGKPYATKMSAFDWSDDQIKAIVTYMKTLNDK